MKFTYEEFNFLWQDRCSSEKWFISFEEQHFQVGDDALNQGENDIVGVQDVDIGGCFAELDAGDNCGLRHGLGRSVRIECFFDGIDEFFLAHVPS